ncbi:hypothetical protein [Lentzea flava]|uniref:Uncharacterized protein n=1 Tax=Lentzea flava TaxID=103732 RepID=A0ABQ2ULJ2_9PSEU|nr:hypothetical protein GCM10010178_40100 [Lentzea flava]
MRTTFAVDETRNVVDTLRGMFPRPQAPPADIRYATTNRHDASQAVIEDSDLVLVVGSANSVRLVETSRLLAGSRPSAPKHTRTTLSSGTGTSASSVSCAATRRCPAVIRWSPCPRRAGTPSC